MNWLIPKAVSKKGMASPAEYTVSKRIPRAIVSLAAASARTAVRIGPMQGVHPKANANPSRKPLQIPGCVMRQVVAQFAIQPVVHERLRVDRQVAVAERRPEQVDQRPPQIGRRLRISGNSDERACDAHNGECAAKRYYADDLPEAQKQAGITGG